MAKRIITKEMKSEKQQEVIESTEQVNVEEVTESTNEIVNAVDNEVEVKASPIPEEVDMNESFNEVEIEEVPAEDTKVEVMMEDVGAAPVNNMDKPVVHESSFAYSMPSSRVNQR